MSSKPISQPEDSAMSLMSHLKELRNRIFKCAIAIAIGAVVGWYLFDPVVDILTEPLKKLCTTQACLASAEQGHFINYDPLDPFTTRLKISAYIGIAISMPVLLYQLWKFVAPGLYQNERRYTLAFIGPALVLFVAGVVTAYYVLPVSLDWLQGVGGGRFEVAYTADKFITLVGWMMIAFGIAFQFPIVLVSLMAIKVLSVRTLMRQWRYFIAGIAVVAGLITPTGDPFTFLFLAVPMVVLYIVAIAIGLLMDRARRIRSG